MSDWYKQYVSILEAAEEYLSLSDAGENYQPGDTEIWYMRASGSTVDPNNLYRTHVMIGTLEESDPEAVFNLMQAENWDPQNRAESMLADFGITHSSMRTGDVIVVDDTAHVIQTDSIEAVELTQ